jgi:hypothetical protein
MSKFLPYAILFVIWFLPTLSNGQESPRKVIQFSGVVVDGDSLQPVPYVNIIIKNTFRGTVSDFYGFFSFVAQVEDTVEFTSVGFRKGRYIIPGDLKDNRYSIIQMLQHDTLLLQETVIYPWPTKEQFAEAFIRLEVPDDDLERARKNLSQEQINDFAGGMPMDASMNYRNTISNYNTRLYTAGQIPMNNLLNPIAWAKFIQSWKNGDFKRK